MTSTSDTPEPNDLHCADDRIRTLLVDGDVVVYDTENPSAWVQSDDFVSLAKRR